MTDPSAPHPGFATLVRSWELALDAEEYAANTRVSYGRAMRGFASWLGEHHDGVAPDEVSRDHIRGWMVAVRTSTSRGTVRSYLPALRHFYRWMLAEGEIARDPTDGIRTPPANDTVTKTLKVNQIKAMLAVCVPRARAGSSASADEVFVARRDAAIILLFVDGGLRLAELTGLSVEAPDIAARMVFVEGKGSNRSGPRRRSVPLGVKATQAIDRYLRAREKHPYAHLPSLWLGARGRATLSADGVDAMLKRRAKLAGIEGLHPHVFRHSWASAFRKAGGSEGDLMVLGGWRNRQMLDRYGKEEASERAQEAYRRLSYGDRL